MVQTQVLRRVLIGGKIFDETCLIPPTMGNIPPHHSHWHVLLQEVLSYTWSFRTTSNFLTLLFNSNQNVEDTEYE